MAAEFTWNDTCDNPEGQKTKDELRPMEDDNCDRRRQKLLDQARRASEG